MVTKTKEALRPYRDVIPDVISRFTFDHHAVINDTGLIVMPQGFARPFYHRQTNTMGLLFSKTANNLRGTVSKKGKMVATTDELERCYIIAARRCRGDVNTPFIQKRDKFKNEKFLRDKLDNFCTELGERNQKHFTGFMAGDIFTNGRLSYEIVKRKSGRYDVMLRLPTRRKDGSFVPFDVTGPKSLRAVFARVSLAVAKSETYEGARLALMKHWSVISSELWDEKNIFQGRGAFFKVKKFLANFVNTSLDHFVTFTGTTVAVGGVTAIFTPGLGIIGGIIGALSHTAMHVSAEKAVEGTYGRREKVRRAKQKLDIDAYDYECDVSDHFKIQNDENFLKLCPHLDLDRFSAEEFELPGLEDICLLKDREQTQNDLQDTCLAGHLLFMHERGFSSVCNMLDRRTEIRMFQSGIVRLMHEKPNGNIVVYAQYRPEVCLNESARLPEHYIKQFEKGIVRVEYNRREQNFSSGLINVQTNIDYSDMVKEVSSKFLFSTQSIVPWHISYKSYQCLYASFTEPKLVNMMNIHRKPPILPDIRAVSA